MFFRIILILIIFIAISANGKNNNNLANLKKIKQQLSFSTDRELLLKQIKKLVKSNRYDFANFVSDESKIDEIEEFITYVYFNQEKVDKKIRKVVISEFPNSKEGVLRLTSMWRKRGSEEKKMMGGCNLAIDYIKEKSQLESSDIDFHYKKVMTKKITQLLKKFYGKKFKKRYVSPLVKYYINPTLRNLQMLSLHAFYTKDEDAYDSVIRSLSTALLIRYSNMNIVID